MQVVWFSDRDILIVQVVTPHLLHRCPYMLRKEATKGSVRQFTRHSLEGSADCCLRRVHNEVMPAYMSIDVPARMPKHQALVNGGVLVCLYACTPLLQVYIHVCSHV